MSHEARRQYVRAIRDRYRESTERGEKTAILNEFTKVCGYSRKYAIRILRGQVEPRQTKPGPKSRYDSMAFVECLRTFWEAMDRMCSKKMVRAIPLWLPRYPVERLDPHHGRLLLAISAATIDRLLAPFRKGPRRGLSGTRPSGLRHTIPIELLDGEVTEPGYAEADTVAHCGDTTAGVYANSLTLTDLATGWTSNRVFLGKSGEDTLAAIKSVEDGLPFRITKFSCDSGSEFINHGLKHYFAKHQGGPVPFVRRRPYRKNDAAHVEQKNYTHVRRLFGYERIEDPATIAMMNEIYVAYWNPLMNFFTPCMKLVRKERIGGRIKKYYDTPKTPCARLLDHPGVGERVKAQLRATQAAYNPFDLKDRLDRRMVEIVRLIDHEIQKRRWEKNRSA